MQNKPQIIHEKGQLPSAVLSCTHFISIFSMSARQYHEEYQCYSAALTLEVREKVKKSIPILPDQEIHSYRCH